jgi:integrase
LTDAMMEILQGLPRFAGGDFLFSNSGGRRPLKPSGFSDPKERLDKLMLEELSGTPLPPFVNHDIRRTCRTRLSSLKIAEEVREAVLAHVRPGIKNTYDLHDYADEKREALTLWASRLRSIIEPPPANVVPMKGVKRKAT